MNIKALKADAIAAINQQRLQSARPLWSQICEVEPADVDNWLILAAIDEQLGFHNAALDHLKYAFLLDPEDIDVWQKSADIKWTKRDFHGALIDISNALRLDFYEPQLRKQFADWLFQLQNYQGALTHFLFLLQNNEPTKEILVRALSCAYLLKKPISKKILALEKILSTIDAPLIEDSVAAYLLQASSQPSEQSRQTSNINSSRTETIFRAVEKKLIDKHQAINWAKYYDNTAHTEAVLLSVTDKVYFNKLSNLLEGRQPIDGEVNHIVEFGCGTGILGQHLKSNNQHILLSGVEHSDTVLRVTNRSDQYDTLIHIDRLGDLGADCLKGLNCIVIQSRVSAYQPRLALLRKILDYRDNQTVVIVGFNQHTDDEQAIITHLIESSVNVQRHHFNGKKNGLSCLYIDSISDEKYTNITRKDDGLETTGNALISAAESLKKSEFEQTIELSEKALTLRPKTPQALFNLGFCHQNTGDHKKALSYYRQARLRYYGYADNWFQIGSIHHQDKKHNAAHNCYRKCLIHNPSHIAAMQNLVGLYFEQGNVDAVWHFLRLMLHQNALNEAVIEKVKNTITQGEHTKLENHLDHFLDSNDWIKIQINAAFEAKYFDRATNLIAKLEKNEESTFLTAQLYEKSGRLSKAKQLLNSLFESHPENALYAMGIATINAAQGLIKPAYEAWLVTKNLAKAENSNLQNFLFYANYCSFLDDETISQAHFDWASTLSSHQQQSELESSGKKNHHKKLRIAYISGDFRMHSVSMFLYNLLKHHDNERFSVYCYSTAPNEDPMSIKLRFFTDYWRNVRSLDNNALADRIKQDEIDILVDLAGHTAENRMPLFILRPAPIQCTYLGYPNTTGIKQIDYRFTDNHADPVGKTEHLHSETLIRLPNGFLSYSRHHTSTPVTLYKNQTSERHYTYACCNNIYKVNEEVVKVFAEILNSAPGSNLLLKAHNLNNPEVIAHYRSLFETYGIGEDQLHLMNTIDMDEHQNLYNNIDIALDPFPYNGTTTSCDALWMGVPVLTLAGTRHAGRVGVSILNQIGLTDWIAHSKAEYIDKAVRFAADKNKLSDIKQSMRQRLLASPLMQPDLVINDIEVAYDKMWQKYQTDNAER